MNDLELILEPNALNIELAFQDSGPAGYSPTVDIEETDAGVDITVNDINGTKTSSLNIPQRLFEKVLVVSDVEPTSEYTREWIYDEYQTMNLLDEGDYNNLQNQISNKMDFDGIDSIELSNRLKSVFNQQ